MRYLIFIAFIYLAYRMIRSVKVHTPDTARTPVGEDMVKDPNCNTYIPLKSAIVASVKGKSHYFCSKECLNSYKNKA